MKFYISSKLILREVVKRMQARLIERGHEISEDWTRHSCARPYDSNVDLSGNNAISDVNGVMNCDIFVQLSDEKGVGMYVELGVGIASYAVRATPLLYVVGKNANESQFYIHPYVKRIKRDDVQTNPEKAIDDIVDECEAKRQQNS